MTALLVTVLLGLCPGLRLPDVASGFAGEVTFFLIGAVGIGAAVESSGLAARAARFLSRSARNSPARLHVQLIAGFPVLALLMPSAITRNAVLIPAYRGALDAMGIAQQRRTGPAGWACLGVVTGTILDAAVHAPIGGKHGGRQGT